MTDLEYAKYLCKKLLYSGEDCCSLCAFNRKDDICDNHKRSEELNCPLDDTWCFVGIRRYAENMCSTHNMCNAHNLPKHNEKQTD